jgi:hypothetical protein
MLSLAVLSIIMQMVQDNPYFYECLYAMCGNAECRYVERRYAECRGATFRVSTEMHFCQKKMNFKDRNEKMAPQQPV